MNPTENILTKLRTHTSTLHSELEQTPISVALLDEQVLLPNYVSYLQKMREVVAFYEGNVFHALADVLVDVNKREKLVLIDKDLAYLSAHKADMPVFEHPNLSNPSVGYTLGCMYVMEGSTLGSKVILKHVSKKLGLVPEEGASYFAGYGEDTGHYWKIFLNTLQEYSANNDSDTEIVTGANDTFRAIKNYFEQ